MSITVSAFRTGDYLAVRVSTAPVVPTASSDRPLNLAFLLDTSDSMSGARLDSVKRTLIAARDLLQPNDRVTLITFGDAATTIAAGKTMDPAGIADFYAAVDQICTNGCTNLSAALEMLATARQQPDAIVILTDGHVNRGVTSTVGLRTMVLGVAGSTPVHTLGYGGDHNRVLLREIATKTHGAYTYVDAEAVLPLAMGDLIGGLRSEVARDAALEVNGGAWVSQELGGATLGALVAGRDYWAIFRWTGSEEAPEPVTVRLGATEPGGISRLEVVAAGAPQTSGMDIDEQILRCRVARLLADASDALESGRPGAVEGNLLAMRTELEGLFPEMRARPLVLRMTAQIAETLEAVQHRHAMTAPLDTRLLSRLSAGATVLCSQRGVSSQDPTNMFSSPLQRTTSDRVRGRFIHPEDEEPTA